MRCQALYFLTLVVGLLFANAARQEDIDNELTTLRRLLMLNDKQEEAQRYFKHLGYATRVVQINDDATITGFAIDPNSAIYRYADLISWNNDTAVYMPSSLSTDKKELEAAFSFSSMVDGVNASVNSFLVAVVNQVETNNLNDIVGIGDGAFISLKNVYGVQTSKLNCYQELVNGMARDGLLKVTNGVGCHLVHDNDGYFTLAIGTDSYAVVQTECKRYTTSINRAFGICAENESTYPMSWLQDYIQLPFFGNQMLLQH